MKRLTKILLEEAKRMDKAWVQANPDGDRDWYIREIASIKGVDHEKLRKKL